MAVIRQNKLDFVNRNQLLLMFILYFFLPRFNIVNANQLVYLLFGTYISLTILYKTRHEEFLPQNYIKRNRSLRFVILLAIVSSVLILLSSIVRDSFSLSNLMNAAKPVFFIIIIFYVISISEKKSCNNIGHQLISASKSFILGQLIVSLLQLFDINMLDQIYISTKSFPIGSLVRVTGTLNNPNLLAWFTLQFLIIIILFDEKKYTKLFYGSIAVLLIILSGSRSNLLIMPLSILLVVILKNKYTETEKLPLIKILSIFTISLCLLVIALSVFRNKVPYMSQLFNVFRNFDMRSISSFNQRFDIWSNAIASIGDGGIPSILFGVGSKSFDAVDNDILYSISRYGILGSILNFSILLIILKIMFKSKYTKIRILMIEYYIFTVIIGLQAETLTGWIYPIIIYIVYGLSIANKNVQGEFKLI